MAPHRSRSAGGLVPGVAVAIALLVAGCGSASSGTTAVTNAEAALASPSGTTSSATSSVTAEPTNTSASSGGRIDVRGPWTTFTDRRGDATPAVDITQVSFANVGRYATVRFRIAHLNWSGSFHAFLSRGDDEDGYMFVNLIAHKSHTTTIQLGGGSRSGEYPVSCPGVSTRYDVKQEEVLLQVPWSCIPPKEDPTVEFDVATNVSGWVRAIGDQVNTHNGLQHAALVKRTP